MVQRKHLFVAHDNVACELCGRTLLTGERAELLAEPGERLRLLCELCAPHARGSYRAPSQERLIAS